MKFNSRVSLYVDNGIIAIEHAERLPECSMATSGTVRTAARDAED